MQELPNLAGVATADLVEKIGAGSFSASYINWSRTMNLLRTNAPGWLPELVRNAEGGMVHRAPAGAYLLIRFRHIDGSTTPEVPQAIMDTRNNSVPLEKISARDITDTHRRGVCMAAAFTFGLGYELWAKLPLETGYAEEEVKPKPDKVAVGKALPTDGAWESQTDEQQKFLLKVAAEISARIADPVDAFDYLDGQMLASEERIALWTRLDSKTRSALKREHDNRKTNPKMEKAA